MIVIQIENNEIELLNEINSLNPEFIEKRNFNGQQELIELLLKLTPVSLPLIAHIITTAIKSKKQIVVKYKGFTIQGLSEKNTVKILEKMIDKE